MWFTIHLDIQNDFIPPRLHRGSTDPLLSYFLLCSHRGEDKLEKQYRLYCPRCNLPIAYETTPHVKGGAFTYIVQGALNEIQGVPHEDWELELPGKTGDVADRDHEDDGNSGHGYDQDQDVEMKIRMEGNQNAAASARAFLAASAKATSTSESVRP